MNPVEPLAAPQRQHLRYLLEQAAHVDDCNFVSRLSRSCQC